MLTRSPPSFCAPRVPPGGCAQTRIRPGHAAARAASNLHWRAWHRTSNLHWQAKILHTHNDGGLVGPTLHDTPRRAAAVTHTSLPPPLATREMRNARAPFLQRSCFSNSPKATPMFKHSVTNNSAHHAPPFHALASGGRRRTGPAPDRPSWRGTRAPPSPVILITATPTYTQGASWVVNCRVRVPERARGGAGNADTARR